MMGVDYCAKIRSVESFVENMLLNEPEIAGEKEIFVVTDVDPSYDDPIS